MTMTAVMVGGTVFFLFLICTTRPVIALPSDVDMVSTRLVVLAAPQIADTVACLAAADLLSFAEMVARLSAPPVVGIF